MTSSVNFSRVASLSWPAGVGAMASARMGRRVGVREIIVGLDCWSVWFSKDGRLAGFDIRFGMMGSRDGGEKEKEKENGEGERLTELDDHVVDGHVFVIVVFQWEDV